MNISQLLESLKNPNISLSAGEKLIAGLSVALLSMVIVFIVLVIIAIIVKLLQNEKQKPENIVKLSQSQNIIEQTKQSNEDIEVLVSVITAAIASATGNNTNNIVVKKITRTNNLKTGWENMTKNTTK